MMPSEKTPTRVFLAFSFQYGLEAYDFSKYSGMDLNITGKAFSTDQKKYLQLEIRREIEPIFLPVIELMETKFNIITNG